MPKRRPYLVRAALAALLLCICKLSFPSWNGAWLHDAAAEGQRPGIWPVRPEPERCQMCERWSFQKL